MQPPADWTSPILEIDRRATSEGEIIMELRHIRYFKALAKCGHFGRAAASLGIHQPPLSQQIKALEEELGVQLFSRTSSGTFLTAAGKVFDDLTVDVLEVIDRASRETARTARGEAGRLVLGFLGSAFHVLLPKVLGAFRLRWPDVSVEPVEFLRTADQMVALGRGTIDVAIGRPPISHSSTRGTISAVALSADLVRVVLPSSHRLAANKLLTPRQLMNEQFVLTPLEERFPFYWHMACTAAGFEPIVVARVRGADTVIGMVAAHIGLAVIPDSAAATWRKDVVFLPLRPEIVAPPLTLMWRTDDETPMRQNFEAVVRRFLRLTNPAMTDQAYDTQYLYALQASVGSASANGPA